MQESLPVKTTISHYRILSKLGAGGMGEVYLAEDSKLERKVALKLLPAEFTQDPDRVRRFVQEAKAASALNHPNIITIYEIGEAPAETGRTHYIATEFIEGQTLRSRMAPEKLSLSATLDVAIQTASALAAAHEAGIIHRDIKPENIMLRRDGILKVLDFGLAKLTEEPPHEVNTQAPTAVRVETDPGTVMGTVTYMSPEQARGQKMDARTDIFSLGVVLYELLAGKVPFDGVNGVEIMAAILTREPAPLSQHQPDLPAELQRIASKALRKDREERYQMVRDLLLDLKSLKQHLEFEEKLKGARPMHTLGEEAAPVAETQPMKAATDEVVSPQTTSSAEYLVGEIKRHKLGAVLALILLLLLSGGAYFYFTHVGDAAIDSIAVLPFVNEKTDPNAEYLADGIPENIINTLSQLPQLKVMSRNSVFGYKGREANAQAVGNELKVAAVLTGHVRQQGGNLWISIELVNVHDGRQIWGQQYNRPLADVFKVQEEIAREVSDKLRLKLTGAEQQHIAKRYTENIKAFEYYTQGRSHLGLRTREELFTAISYYEKAIGEDGNYALAFAGIAETYANLGGRGYLPPVEARRKAEEAAQKALALDENLAEVHLAIGEISVLFGPFDFVRADRALQRALELSPSLASVHQYLGNLYVLRARYDDALREFLKARELDPLSSILARLVVGPYYYRRDYARALDLLKQANELRPSYLTLWEVGVYIESKEFDYAWAELEKEKQQRKDDVILIESAGKLYAAQGRRAEALQVIKELETISGPDETQAAYIAAIYAMLGEKEQAFAWLNRAMEAGTIWFFIKDDPLWDNLRSDPRFADALRRMNLTP